MPKPGKIYLPLDVNYFDDPDIIELSDAAQLHDIRALCLSKRIQSDGVLTRRQFARIAPDSDTDSDTDSVSELTDRGIWIDKGAALERRGWMEWNDSAEKIALKSRGGRLGNHLKWHVSGKKEPSKKCEFCVDEGLVSLPSRIPSRSSSDRREDTHVDIDVDTDMGSTGSAAYEAREIAGEIEQRCATVEEARAELKSAGFDERTTSTVIALLPNLRSAS